MPIFACYDPTTGDVLGVQRGPIKPADNASHAFLEISQAQADGLGALKHQDNGPASWRVVSSALQAVADTRPILDISISPAEADNNEVVTITFQAKNAAGANITPTATRKIGVVKDGALSLKKVSLVSGSLVISRMFAAGGYRIVSVDSSFRVQGTKEFSIYEAF